MLLIIPNVLNKEQVELVLREIGEGAYEDGRVSAGDLARDVKKNLQIKRDAAAAQKCAPMILEVLRRNSLFFSIAFPHKINGPIFNRYDVGMTYGLHVDNALMGEPASIRSDVSATLFLSAPESYDGGELILSEHQGERRIKIHGQQVNVRAEVVALNGLSAHADADEILDWLRTFEAPPRETFITHGEPRASDALRRRIQDELGWSARAPEHLERVELG